MGSIKKAKLSVNEKHMADMFIKRAHEDFSKINSSYEFSEHSINYFEIKPFGGNPSYVTYRYDNSKGEFNTSINCRTPEVHDFLVQYANFWEDLSDEYDIEFTADVKRDYVTDNDLDNFFSKKGSDKKTKGGLTPI